MKISKPGHYRTKHGLRAEVTSIRGDKAVGWVEADSQSHPSAWGTEEGQIWNGRWGDDLVAEWREPLAKSTTILLCETTTGDHYLAFDNVANRYRVLARKSVTITEGEGMSTAEEKSPDL